MTQFLVSLDCGLRICKFFFLSIYSTQNVRHGPRVEAGRDHGNWPDKYHGMTGKDLELFQNRLVHKYYRLQVLITLEQVDTSVFEKKKNLNEQNFYQWCSW